MIIKWLARFSAPVAAAQALHAADLASIPFKTIDGNETKLGDYAGKVVLVVNTASKCGLTPQYEGLEVLYRKHRDEGLLILAFPCNDFMGQEPGTPEEIAAFCKTRYDVSFPLMEKIHVKGPDQHPLFAALTAKDGPFPGPISWNFSKFLISKEGKAVARFEPRQAPDHPDLAAAIARELAK